MKFCHTFSFTFAYETLFTFCTFLVRTGVFLVEPFAYNIKSWDVGFLRRSAKQLQRKWENFCDNQEAIYYIGQDNQLHLYSFDNGCTPRPEKRSMSANTEDDRTRNMAAAQAIGKKTLATPTFKAETTQLSPNPFTDHLIIKSDLEQFDEIRITDMVGRIYYQSKTGMTSSKTTIDTRTFPSGLYLMLLLNKGELVSQIKAVKL